MVIAFHVAPYGLLRAGFLGVDLLVVACFAFRRLDPEHWQFTHLRADALFAGVVLRYFLEFRPRVFRVFRSPFALLVGVTFWITPYVFTRPAPALRSAIFTWTAVACASLVGWCFAHDHLPAWRTRPLSWVASVGFYSYSIYLWQGPLCLIALGGGWAFSLLGFALSITVGIFMSKLVELPTLALRDRLLTSSSRGLPVTESSAAVVDVYDSYAACARPGKTGVGTADAKLN